MPLEAPGTATPPVPVAANKDELFALFGPDASVARKTHDPPGNQTLEELKQQVVADRSLAEPVRQ